MERGSFTESEIEDIKRANEWPKQEKAIPINPIFNGQAAVLIGTGPSLNAKQIEIVKSYKEENKCKVFTINNAYEVAPFSDVHFAGDASWWEIYYKASDKLRDMGADKYTWYPDTARKFNLKYIAGDLRKPGLSFDPSIIHINGSGPSSINLAMHYGVNRLLLIGHDMKYADDYNGHNKKSGATPRHFFGEYPEPLRQWPKVGVSQSGTLDCLIKIYNNMTSDLKAAKMQVINCTPGSALSTFPMADLEEELAK